MIDRCSRVVHNDGERHATSENKRAHGDGDFRDAVDI